ncbi:hypothetical protein D9M69_708410 [compost metagenome]
MFGVQRLGHNALGGTLFYVFAIGFKHSFTLISGPGVVQGAHPGIRRTHAPHSFLGCLAKVSAASIEKLFSKFYAGRKT